MDAFALNVQFSPCQSNLGPTSSFHLENNIYFQGVPGCSPCSPAQRRCLYKKAMQRDSSCSLCPGSWRWMSCVDARRQDPGWKLGAVSLGDTQPCHSWPQRLEAAAVLIPKAALFSTYSISPGSGLVGGISSVCQPQTL